ncbi:MAG: carboxypeptidase regulatory-like domain-containing protein [Acidobacteria bacterium]|nr:carboxypeptidase regulatory-like domain-containing protein [Acidobacteriota bacterium]
MSRAPIASATVAIQGRSATTGADGRYTISDLTNGQAQLTAQHQGHRNFSQTLTLAGTTTFDVAMTSGLESRAAGNWSGSWRNTTFGSTGSMTMTVSPDTIAQTLALTFDLNGPVFGASRAGDSLVALADPSPETIRGSYTTDVAVLRLTGSPLFGNFSCDVLSSGPISCVGPDVPGTLVAQARVTGDILDFKIVMKYILIFESGGMAEGEITLDKVGVGF